MPITQEERKTIIPTLIIGIGGTGLEVIMRVRRLVTESYGSLQNFPIVGFLHIDTDQNAKPDNPLMAGPPLENFEIYRSQVNLQEAQKIVKDSLGYEWYHEWLPSELVANPQLLVSQEGAGQIRACGRFSFFYNYPKIGDACIRAKNQIRRGDRVSFMSEKHGLKVLSKLNVFVVCSIAGGTGSGMLIDLGYALRHRWLEGEPGLETTAIISSPDVFGSVDANSRVRENGYAALMELNYFSDNNTTFNVRYGAAEGSRIVSEQPPYDYVYLVGTSNEQGVNLKLDDVREMIAQNIFLDLVSDFSAYKRSIRDNLKRASAGQNDEPPQGRSYPRNFMSFGLATIEIPIHHIRNCLGARLAADLCQWWEQDDAPLPPAPQTIIDAELREMRLLDKELRQAILRSSDSRPYQAFVAQWMSNIRQEIISENLLQCTAQGPNVFAKEQSKILDFVDRYLSPKVNQYLEEHFRDDSPDERLHGDFLLVMYDNRNYLISSSVAMLQEKLYTYLTDRNRGPRFLQIMLDLMERSFNSDIEKFKREAEKTWLVVEEGAFKEYLAALYRINEFRLRWGLNKQEQMNKECDTALKYLEQSWQSFLERKSRVIGVAVLERMKEIVTELRRKLEKWQLRVSGSKGKFTKRSEQEANQADALEIVGIKLFERQEINDLYQNFLSSMVNNQQSSMTSAAKRGLEVLCDQMTKEILSRSSPLWVESREARATFRLLDMEKVEEVQYPDLENIVYQTAHSRLIAAPVKTKLHSDMDACTRFMQMFPQTTDQDARIQMLFEQSKPLVRLDTGIPQNSRFGYISLAKAGLLGGNNPTEPAAQKQAEIFRKYFTAEQAIAPLTERERHKILAVHEIGGFSLRCIQGTEQIRRSYQNWRGRRVMAERARLRGRQADLLPSVHLQKDMIFWDFIPPAPKIEELVVISRALGILRDEINQYTNQHVICYSTPINGQQERETLAANWEDAVQVLELPDCGNDKREVEHQVEKLLESAETPQQKQELRQRLDSFLNQRLRDFRKQGGEYNPRYLREKDIIRGFIAANQLETATDVSSPQDSQLTSSINSEAVQSYEQHLSQLSSLKLPKNILIDAAHAKAKELNLDTEMADSILRKFIEP